MEFADISGVPGVLLAFQWSDAGELVAISRPEADALSDRLGACAAAASRIDEATFGSLVELHVYGKDENAALFMTKLGPSSAYCTIGTSMAGDLEPQSFIEYMREATS